MINEGVKCVPIYTLQLCMRDEECNVVLNESVQHVIQTFNCIYYIDMKNYIYNHSEYNDLQVKLK